ncbi:hypothetical protein PIB30_062641, partial [Stylosanthes scabra]|nr:hypothetical protein [Stylosanthes scabra]
MGDTFVVPIFHHGGDFIQSPLGDLMYANGLVERFEEMDIDKMNFEDMKKLLEGLGYRNFMHVYWLDKNAPELETGLNLLEGYDGIRELIDHLKMNLEFEFHLYWKHVINEPVLAENAGGEFADDGGCDNVAGAKEGNLAGGFAHPVNLESEIESGHGKGANGDDIEAGD